VVTGFGSGEAFGAATGGVACGVAWAVWVTAAGAGVGLGVEREAAIFTPVSFFPKNGVSVGAFCSATGRGLPAGTRLAFPAGAVDGFGAGVGTGATLAVSGLDAGFSFTTGAGLDALGLGADSLGLATGFG